VEHWQDKLRDSSRLKIGVAWQGNAEHRCDRHRSFAAQWLETLASLDGVALYSLQKGLGSDQLRTAGFPIADLGSALDEMGHAFQETAAVMRALDLVITCDSALAHLAGALGVPVWLALSTVSDWRWLQDRDDSPWYPTMRLFRQRNLGEWGPVFARIRDEVEVLRPKLVSGIGIEIAPGELLDKLTILRIKAERITDAAKLRSVRTELALLENTCRQRIPESSALRKLLRELQEVNERLWDTENRLRVCEKSQDFGKDFIALARSVYHTNDWRAAVKRKINELLGAPFREEKEYHS
jgi:hypothetical protein